MVHLATAMQYIVSVWTISEFSSPHFHISFHSPYLNDIWMAVQFTSQTQTHQLIFMVISCRPHSTWSFVSLAPDTGGLKRSHFQPLHTHTHTLLYSQRNFEPSQPVIIASYIAPPTSKVIPFPSLFLTIGNSTPQRRRSTSVHVVRRCAQHPDCHEKETFLSPIIHFYRYSPLCFFYFLFTLAVALISCIIYYFNTKFI